MEFIVNGLEMGRIVRIECGGCLHTRECVALEADTSLGPAA